MISNNRNISLLFPELTGNRKKELHIFEKHAGIRFRSIDLLNLAFIHRSYANETNEKVDNNEKLEFLGDSILGLVVSEYLFKNLEDKSEGDLAKIKSFVVSESSLEIIAKKIKVDNYILIGKGEEFSGGRQKKAILADCLEAIFGAYFLDSNYKDSKKFILKYLVPQINSVLENKHQKDYKTLLQEYVQKKYKNYPKYKVIKKTGPDHNKTFWVEVEINSKLYGPGKGRNKKEAEQNAAGLAYKALNS